MTHNSQDAGKKNLRPHSDRDSPRRLSMSRIRRVGVPEHGLDNGMIGPGDGIFPVHWPDSDGWPRAAAIDVLPSGKPNCNNGSTGVAAENAAHNPSKDKSDGQDANERLAPIVIHGKAEMMGPTGASTPRRSSLVAKGQLRSEAIF
jgi:hypothetical protein